MNEKKDLDRTEADMKRHYEEMKANGDAYD